MQQDINKIIFKNPSQDSKGSFYCNTGGELFCLKSAVKEGIVARSGGEEREQHAYRRIMLWIYHPQSSSMIHSLS